MSIHHIDQTTNTPPEAPMPHSDPGSEAAILGAALTAPPNPQGTDPIAAAQNMLTDDDWAVPTHLTVWRAITDLYGAGKPTSPPAVAARLSTLGELQRIGGQGTLAALTQQACPAVNVPYYASLIQGQGRLRRYRQALVRALNATNTADPEHPTDTIQAHLADVESLTTDTTDDDGSFVRLGDRLDAHLDKLAEPSTPPDAVTGFTDLDNLMHLESGQMIVVAARPAMGKSAFALNVAVASATAGTPTIFVSIEMGEKEVTNRVLAARSRVAFHHLRGGQGTLTEGDWNRLDKHTPGLRELPLYMDYSARVSPSRLRSRVKTVERTEGRRPLVVVDYLQLMQTDSRDTRQSPYERATEISRELKILAQDTGAVIIALAQLNRGPEQRPDKKPMTSDLRDSGALEQDADGIILLHREDYYEPESPRAGETSLIVAKHRNGPTATITVAHQFHYSRLLDMGS